MPNFEDFLMDQFVADYSGQLRDDDISDKFEGWMEKLDVQEVMDYAEAYSRQTIEKLIEDAMSYMPAEPSTPFVRKELEAKWLGKENNSATPAISDLPTKIAGLDFGPSLTALDELGRRTNETR
jgi:hypothetical protein